MTVGKHREVFRTHSGSLTACGFSKLSKKKIVVRPYEVGRLPTAWQSETNDERTGMTKIEAIIQLSKLEAVKQALQDVGAEGMTVFEARGHGQQKGHTEFYRGREYTVDLIPKAKLEIVLADGMVEKVVQAIIKAAQTGKIGDGKIFLSRIDDAIRIRNEERGDGAL